jgi:hypothetical protein
MNFTTQLMSHIGSLPTQKASLPPSFIVSFVARCFHPCLSLVDFPQALTALDYLTDLEKRRCKEYVAAFERLGISIDNFEHDVAAIADRYPGIALWAKNMHGKNKKAQQYYGLLYVLLRRWTMINELSLQPFSKSNCIGMLNTLFPPHAPSGNTKLSTPLLSEETLRDERNTFFDYIRLLPKRGTSVLQPMIEGNREPGDETGWDRVQRVVDKYLRVAKNMIDDCINTTGPEKFNAVADEETRKGKKTDSGVSFGSERRPSTGASVQDKPLPVMPSEPKSPGKGLSKLERITREFKRMRVKTRPDVEEIVKVDRQDAASRLPMTGEENKGKKSLKKARSFANIGGLRHANVSSTSLASSRKGSDAIPFDAEEMRRHRMMYEASTTNKGSKNII